jgi:hypothetical protein
MHKKKDKVIFVLADGEFHARVNAAAEIATEGNISRLTREALNEKIERLAELHPQHRKRLAQAA